MGGVLHHCQQQPSSTRKPGPFTAHISNSDYMQIRNVILKEPSVREGEKSSAFLERESYPFLFLSAGLQLGSTARAADACNLAQIEGDSRSVVGSWDRILNHSKERLLLITVSTWRREAI